MKPGLLCSLPPILLAIVFDVSGARIAGAGNLGRPGPAGAEGFHDPEWHIWCGAPIQGDDGRFHLLYSRWPLSAGFAPGWALRSEIAHAVADRPLGPYRHTAVVLPARGLNPATGVKYWDADVTHNPNILRLPDGRFALFYMGNHGDGKSYPMHRNNQRIGVALADRPEGPWRRFDRPVLDVGARPGDFDSLCVTNPAAAVTPDGTILLVYKAVTQAPGKEMGGVVRHGVARAEKIEGPYIKLGTDVFEGEGTAGAATWMLVEDPFIWWADGAWHGLGRDAAGRYTGDKGAIARFVSADGRHWRPAVPALFVPGAFRYADGRVSDHRLERPALLFEKGQPTVLFGAADGYPKKRGVVSRNVQFPLIPPSP